MVWLDNKNLAISVHKYEFAQTETIWLGYQVSPNRIIPTEKKTNANAHMEEPHTLKQLWSFMGSKHHMKKFIPNLSNITAPLPLLSTRKSIKGWKLKRSIEHDIAFKKIKEAIKYLIENKHFDTTKSTKVICYASKNGLEACLEQLTNNNGFPISHAIRFLNSNEQKHSINELELLATVGSQEGFKYYLYGSKIEIEMVHQTLLSALRNNRGNKTYQIRLTRWLDRLLPFDFTVQHKPEKQMGFADYFSMYPISPAPQYRKSDKNYVANLIDSFKHLLKNAHRISTKRKAEKRRANNDVIKQRKQIKIKHTRF